MQKKVSVRKKANAETLFLTRNLLKCYFKLNTEYIIMNVGTDIKLSSQFATSRLSNQFCINACINESHVLNYKLYNNISIPLKCTFTFLFLRKFSTIVLIFV